MITNITLENFKCFRKLEVNPRLITVFVGPNGSGKSSVLQAMALLKQSTGDRLKLDSSLVSAPSFDSLQPNFGQSTGAMGLAFSGTHQGKLVEYKIESINGNRAVKKREPAGIPEQLLKNMAFVPATRGFVRPRYGLGSETVEDVSLAGGISQQENQTATNLAYARYMEQRISKLLRRVTGVGLRTDIVPSLQVEVIGLTDTGDINMVLEGFGSNSLVLLLLQLVTAINGSTVMIEEPESHLHPRAQAELASVLADEAKSQSKQIIMTTHSEHILGRLLTLVAEKKLALDELAIYAFEKDEKGVCTASQLEITEDGRVKGGIKDFFESELEEVNRYIKALQSDQ